MNTPFDKRADPSWQTTSEYLDKYFRQAAAAKCLIWVNPAQFDPFETVPLVLERRVRVPINHPRFDVGLAPYLVPLDLSASPDAELFEDSVKRAWDAWTIESLKAFNGQPIAGWVITEEPALALARHWAWRCHLHTRSGSTKFIRFHDPSVREWLWPTFTEQQRHSLLGPSNTVLAIGRGRTVLYHTRQAAPTATEVIPSLALDERQWTQLDDYATVHAAWVEWLTVAENQGNYTTGWEQDVLKALSNASRYGVTDARDRELFALHALQLGPDFDAAEKMRPVWVKTLSGEYYGSALEQVFAQPADLLHLHLKLN